MFAIVGALATAAVCGLLSSWGMARRLVLLLAASAGIWVLLQVSGVATRGPGEWWQQPLWRNLLLYLAMFTGMMFRVVWEQIDAWRQANVQSGARRKRRPRFQFWDFVYPVMPSLALFQAVLWTAGDNPLTFQLFLGSFQNGFFWHALLAKSRENAEKKIGVNA
jgi:hypothetical protein